MNVIITAFRGETSELLRALKGKGSFSRTAFRDVIKGEVEDFSAFLDDLSRELPLSLSRVVPLDEVFSFKESKALIRELTKRVLSYAVKIKGSFRVTVERRGLKGVVDSRALERELGELLFEHLKSKGLKPKVDLEQPDSELVIEILTNECGLVLLTKKLKDKYSFVRA